MINCQLKIGFFHKLYSIVQQTRTWEIVEEDQRGRMIATKLEFIRSEYTGSQYFLMPPNERDGNLYHFTARHASAET